VGGKERHSGRDIIPKFLDCFEPQIKFFEEFGKTIKHFEHNNDVFAHPALGFATAWGIMDWTEFERLWDFMVDCEEFMQEKGELT
jgi:hypothetical protein